MFGNKESEYFVPVKNEASPVMTTSTIKAPPVKSPHNCEAILRDADPPVSVSSVNLFEQLRSGVFLKPTKQIKYWVDERNSNCFMLFAKNLSVTWSDDPNYWTWFTDRESPNEYESKFFWYQKFERSIDLELLAQTEKEKNSSYDDFKSETAVEAAELENVCWLDIVGKFDTRNLTPGITYEVVFKVKLEDPAYGWDTPVNLKLVLPYGKEKPQEQKVSLRELPRYKWVDIRVGEFVTDKSAAGEITFSMYEHEAGVWKKGLFLKGVTIRPKH